MNAPSPLMLAQRAAATFSTPTPSGIACGYCSSGPPTKRTQVFHATISDVRHCARVADYRAGYANYEDSIS